MPKAHPIGASIVAMPAQGAVPGNKLELGSCGVHFRVGAAPSRDHGEPEFSTGIKRYRGLSVRALFIEDDPALVRALKSFFRRHPQYEIEFATTGDEALRMLARATYALVVIDWNLPDTGPNGLEVCRILGRRPRSNRPGIVFVTGRDDIDDKLRAFDAGADDYLVKPFDARELMARLDSLSMRSTPPPPSAIDGGGARLRFGPMMIDLATQVVLVDSREIMLPKQQFLILVHLVRRAGNVASERELRNNVLRTRSTGRSSSVRNLVRELRYNLGDAGELVETIYGLGYRVVEPENVGKK